MMGTVVFKSEEGAQGGARGENICGVSKLENEGRKNFRGVSISGVFGGGGVAIFGAGGCYIQRSRVTWMSGVF